MNYSLSEKTYCALAWATHHLRQYMLNYTTWLVSKMDPIKYNFEKPALTERIARWQVLLSEFDIVYVTQRPLFLVSQDSTSFVFSFIGLNVFRFQFHRTQLHLFLVSQDSTPFVFNFIGLNVLCFYVSQTQSPQL